MGEKRLFKTLIIQASREDLPVVKPLDKTVLKNEGKEKMMDTKKL